MTDRDRPGWMTVGREALARHRSLVALTLLQAACALYFVADVVTELPEARTAPMHPLVELVAVVALLVGTVISLGTLRRLLAQNGRMRHRAQAASGAFVAMMEQSFARWRLTAAERDVALLSVKGLSVAEIAALRGARVGTVKAQSAAIYRKAGVNSRAELLGLFIEDLMAGVVLEPLDEAAEAQQGTGAPRGGGAALRRSAP